MRFAELDPYILAGHQSEIMGLSFRCPFCKATKLAVFVCNLGSKEEEKFLKKMGNVVLPTNIRATSPKPDLKFQINPNHSMNLDTLTLKIPNLPGENLYRLEFPGHWSGVIVNGELAA